MQILAEIKRCIISDTVMLTLVGPHHVHGMDVTRSVVCVLGTRVSCAKTAELIEMPFGQLTRMGSRNRVLDGGQDAPM